MARPKATPIADNVVPLDAVRQALDAPIDAPPVDDGDGGGGGAPGGGGGGTAHSLPDGCPVQALGTEGGAFYFLTTLGELRELTADKVANRNILAMFAPKTDYLREVWPRRTKVKSKHPETGEMVEEWITTGWRVDDCTVDLMDAAAARGVWSAREKVRGRGAWIDDRGGLVLHCGNRVLIDGHWMRPGLHHDMVYSTAPAIPRPVDVAVAGGEHGPAGQLLSLLRTWNWARPELDPELLLGWIVQAMMGAAIDWRALAWITGNKATGKSTLQKLIAWIFDGALLSTSNATEAAVRQLLGQQSLPVAIDEAEAAEDNRKLQALLELARQASSGGTILRGGQDHHGHEFRANSAFLFSSIYTPPMLPQDRSRMALLELGPLAAGARERPELLSDKGFFGRAGRELRARVVQMWPQWARTLEAYRDMLVDKAGHGGRGADQFGVLLAAQHIALFDRPPTAAQLGYWAAQLRAGALAETSGGDDEEITVLRHLGSSAVRLAKGHEEKVIAEWLLQATKPLPPGVAEFGAGASDYAAIMDGRRLADLALQRVGLRVVANIKGLTPGRSYLAVANQHAGLADLFRDTHWGARSGANGVWAQALKRADGAVSGIVVKIAGQPTRCTCVPLDLVIQHDEEASADATEEEVY